MKYTENSVVNLKQHTYFLYSASNVGIVEMNGDAYLIDAGNSGAKVIMDFCKRNSFNISRIYLTHAHSDHIKQAYEFQKTFNCSIYCPEKESMYARFPMLHIMRVFGAVDDKLHKHPHIDVNPVKVHILNPETSPFTVVPLPGHHLDMVGYMTPDNIFFAGDSIYGNEMLNQHPILFNTDIEACIETLKKLTELECDLLVPSHGIPIDKKDLGKLVNNNITHIEFLIEAIIEELGKSPHHTETLAEALIDSLSIKTSHLGYRIIVITLRNYLDYLIKEGKVKEPAMDSGFRYVAIG